MPDTTLQNLSLWDMPNNAGNPAITGTQLVTILGEPGGFVTLDTVQTITAVKTFDADLILANSKRLRSISTTGIVRDLAQIDASNINILSNADANTIIRTNETLIINANAARDTILDIEASAGNQSILRWTGADINQPITDLQPADTALEIRPFSGVGGGAQITAISDIDATGLLLCGYFGVTNPSDTRPAVSFRAGKSNGATGIAALSAAETAYAFRNHDGSVTYMSILGSGSAVFILNVKADSLNISDFSTSGATNGMQINNLGQLQTSANVTTSQAHHLFYNPNGVVGTISTLNSATAYNTSSDPRLKSKFTPFNTKRAWEKFDLILAASGTFNFHVSPDVEEWGFNAHTLIDSDIEMGTEGQGPRDAKIGSLYKTGNKIKSKKTGKMIVEKKQVTPAGVDQAKAIPFLLAVIDDLRNRLDAAGL